MAIYIIFGLVALVSFLVSQVLQSKFKKYSAVPLSMSGKEIAEKMLRDNGINHVQVLSVEGQLTDHYNPTDGTVNLSQDVYYGRSVAAAAVAAHECGHAIQHANEYPWLTMRSSLVPVVSIASQYVQWILLAGILLVSIFPWLLGIGIIIFASTTLFSFITLPVEINASVRAIKWLDATGIVAGTTKSQAIDALKWAAYTYVVAALGSLATLVYYILIFINRRN